MVQTSIITPKVAEGFVSHQTNLGVDSHDLDELYSPDTAFWKSKVLDLASPKYSPNATYIFDKSRYNNHGTIVGATWVRLPSGLWGLLADGFDDSVIVQASATLRPVNAITIDMWFKLTATPSAQVATFVTDGNDGFYFSVTTGLVLSAILDYNQFLTTLSPLSGAISINKPYKITFTYDRQFMRLYLNGNLDCTPVAKTGAMDFPILAWDILFASGINCPYYQFLSKFYSELALSADQIKQQYQQERHFFRA